MNTSTLINDLTMTILHQRSNQEETRFVYIGFYIVLMIVDLWLIISLIHYGIKTKKWRRLQLGNPNLLNSGRIYLSVVICSITAFSYHLFTAVYRNIGFHQNEAQFCKAVTDMVFITYFSSFLSVIFFLWFRQRALYRAFLPVARFTKLFNFFSFFSLFISSILTITGVILSILKIKIDASPIGCVFKNNSNIQLNTFLIFSSASIFSQVSLLVVFSHALLVMQEHVKKRWKSLFCCKHQLSIENTREQPFDQRKTIVDKIIKKQLFLQLCLCCLTYSLFL